MAFNKDFPANPHHILDPSIRWIPSIGQMSLQNRDLLPPLITKLRQAVKMWRDQNYEGASQTSKQLLAYWFEREHFKLASDNKPTSFQYYFAQREAVETIIYLCDVLKFKEPINLIPFDSSGFVSTGMFDENWRRLVVKMATGTGKTKVLSLILAWSFFHKTYEADSDLARNFLMIAPNLIVLERLKVDFEALKIFDQDPIIPDNGWQGRNWKSDFQLTVHIQDQVNITQKIGNIFLTNIHRVFLSNNQPPSFTDQDTKAYFLGVKPTGEVHEGQTDLGEIVRSVDELVILNDEAHHIHAKNLEWFKSIEGIHQHLKLKRSKLALQIDVTATPKDQAGNIFVQTISDYPLVEAIAQNVVKHPVIPDEASRTKLVEKQSIKFSERFSDYLELGVIEWRKTFLEHQKMNEKAILFVMTDDTKNCDDVAQYLEGRFSDLAGRVLTIHTKKTGEIKESELNSLRDLARTIDDPDNKYRAIVSVLMLKEGWDVRNVTTIVGLRSYSAKAKILPEQTLGRGLRLMYPNSGVEEYVNVLGTDAFLDLVNEIKTQGVELEAHQMGKDSHPKIPVMIEVDPDRKGNPDLEIEIPSLSPKLKREFKDLNQLSLDKFRFTPLSLKTFSSQEKREIVFKHFDDELNIHHTTTFDTNNPNFLNVIGYFARRIIQESSLVRGYDQLYPLVQDFIVYKLFNQAIALNDLNVLRNLSEPQASQIILNSFKDAINQLTIVESGGVEVQGYLKLSQTPPFLVKDQSSLLTKKSLFAKIVGDSGFELEFARFLDRAEDVIAWAKNFKQIGFKLDYVNAEGVLSNYYPDFLVKTNTNEVYIVETKGLEDKNASLKRKRLQSWCIDVNSQTKTYNYKELYVLETAFKSYASQVSSFEQLVRLCE